MGKKKQMIAALLVALPLVAGCQQRTDFDACVEYYEKNVRGKQPPVQVDYQSYAQRKPYPKGESPVERVLRRMKQEDEACQKLSTPEAIRQCEVDLFMTRKPPKTGPVYERALYDTSKNDLKPDQVLELCK